MFISTKWTILLWQQKLGKMRKDLSTLLHFRHNTCWCRSRCSFLNHRRRCWSPAVLPCRRNDCHTSGARSRNPWHFSTTFAGQRNWDRHNASPLSHCVCPLKSKNRNSWRCISWLWQKMLSQIYLPEIGIVMVRQRSVPIGHWTVCAESLQESFGLNEFGSHVLHLMPSDGFPAKTLNWKQIEAAVPSQDRCLWDFV